MTKFFENKYYNYIVLIIFSFLRFGGDALFYSYVVRFYRSFNFNDFSLGLLLSIIPFMAVLGNAFLSKFATSLKKNVIILKIWMLIEAVILMLTGFMNNFYILLVLAIISNFCNNSFYNLFDTFIVEITSKIGKTYASGRIFGTLSYIVFSFTGGFLISFFTYKYTFLLAGILFFLSFICFFFFRFDKDRLNKNSTEVTTYKEVFSNKSFIFYFLFIILFYSSFLLTDTLFSLYSKDINISDSKFGMFFSLAVLIEALFLFLLGIKFSSNKFFKVSIFLSCLVLILRCLIFSIPNLNEYVYLSAELLRGVSYSLLLISNVNILICILGKYSYSKGLFICLSIVQLFQALGAFFIPKLISFTSYTFAFSMIIGICLLSLVFLSISFKLLKNQEAKINNLR